MIGIRSIEKIQRNDYNLIDPVGNGTKCKKRDIRDFKSSDEHINDSGDCNIFWSSDEDEIGNDNYKVHTADSNKIVGLILCYVL